MWGTGSVLSVRPVNILTRKWRVIPVRLEHPDQLGDVDTARHVEQVTHLRPDETRGRGHEARVARHAKESSQ